MKILNALAAAAVVVGCSKSERIPQASGAVAYIVLDEHARQAFSLTGSDTLAEVARAVVPDTVRAAAKTAATIVKFDPACTRFFSSETGFAALLTWKCTGDEGFNDGQDLVFFRNDGAMVAGPTKGSAPPSYTALVPPSRLKQE